MSDSIGGVSFTEPVTRGTPTNAVLGSDVRTMSGAILSLRGDPASGVDYERSFRFWWQPLSVVEGLINLWRAGGEYGFSLDGLGGYARFAASNGVTGIQHVAWQDASAEAVSGTDLDIYNGEINLIIIDT